MFSAILTKIIGSKNDRDLKQIAPIVQRINELEAEMARRSETELAGLTPKFRERLANEEPLDDILPEAFAAVREVAKRILNMRHFDVQILGGIAMFHHSIAEMQTGEGKTLTATLPMYLHALVGKGILSQAEFDTKKAELLAKLDTLIVSDILPNETTKLAHFVLPGCAHAEKRGTFTNGKGRVQKFMKAVEAPGDARAEWKFLHDLVHHVTGQNGFVTIEGLFNQMAKEVPAFSGLTWQALGDTGVTVEI